MAETPPAAATNKDAEAMAKFLSFLSHDLRGGLNGAVLMLEVVRRQLAKDDAMTETLGDLEMVRRSILETVALMDRFVFAERLRLQRVAVTIGGVDLCKLLAMIVNDSRIAAEERGVVVTVDCEMGLIVQSDENLLKRTLAALLENALKFGRRQPVQIRAISGAAATSSVAARIEITDHGGGVSAVMLSQLEEPLIVSEAYGEKRVGMGLYVARRAAKLINATLRCESDAGHGTTMILELPQLAAGAIK